MSRYLVTGATGFLGAHVAQALRDHGHVAALRRNRHDLMPSENELPRHPRSQEASGSTDPIPRHARTSFKPCAQRALGTSWKTFWKVISS